MSPWLLVGGYSLGWAAVVAAGIADSAMRRPIYRLLVLAICAALFLPVMWISQFRSGQPPTTPLRMAIVVWVSPFLWLLAAGGRPSRMIEVSDRRASSGRRQRVVGRRWLYFVLALATALLVATFV
jgi:hypothetical protein